MTKPRHFRSLVAGLSGALGVLLILGGGLLTMGQRVVKIDLRIRERLIGEDESQRDLFLCHGLCELGSSRLITVLVQFRDFLILNPGEIIILIFEDSVPATAVAGAFEKSGLVYLVYRGPARPHSLTGRID